MTSKVRSTKVRSTIVLSVLGVTLAAAVPAHADDVSVFGTQAERPNVLLVLDYSDSMNLPVSDTEGRRRIDVMRTAVNSVLDEFAGSIDFGLGPLFSGTVGGVLWPVGDLADDASTVDPTIPAGALTSRDVVRQIMESTGVRPWTSTAAAMAEAGLYFAGLDVSNGGSSVENAGTYRPNRWDASSGRFGGGHRTAPHPGSYTPADAYTDTAPRTGYCRDYDRSSGSNYCSGLEARNCVAFDTPRRHKLCEYTVEGTFAGATYRSPITASGSCQANVILLVSDGKPANGDNADAYEALLGHPPSECEQVRQTIFSNEARRNAGNCAIEIADRLATRAVSASFPDSRVTTHTIGFGFEPDDDGRIFLERVAEAGTGEYFDATTPSELESSLRSIISSIPTGARSFGTAVVDVDRARGTNDDRAYLPLFKPSAEKYWKGNLKGYYIGSEGLKSLDRSPATTAEATGVTFVNSAQSFWSDVADGADVSAGGASGRLVERTNRTLLTFLGLPTAVPADGTALIGSGLHELTVGNAALTDAMLGAPREEIIPWLAAQPMGAPLHSNVVIADYDERRVVFGMTNQGFLHAIDATTPATGASLDTTGGGELFAFMPRELLSNLEFMRGGGFPGEHVYGLDGGITPWHTDVNNDGKVNGSDKLLLVFGMRRGGPSYYALDVTDPLSPKFAWQIDGGTVPFQALAQTWSHPALLEVKSGSGSERVLVFGGGYDDSVDDLNRATPSSGNSIFMVDARGQRIWSARDPDMNFAIPSDVTAIDSDGDGLADRLYVADLGSQLWRVDFDDVRQRSSFSLSRVADLSSGEYRPVFHAPVVSRRYDETGEYLSVAFGTGNRDDPLQDSVRGAFFVFKDRAVDKGARSRNLGTRVLDDLYDTTANRIASTDESSAATARSSISGGDGWYIELQPGEKSLSRMTLLDGRLLATTLLPIEAPADGSCGIVTTESRFYVMDADTGAAVDEAGTVLSDAGSSRRFRVIDGVAIPPSPLVLIAPGSDSVDVLVGKEVVMSVPRTLDQVFWAQDR